jgi:hypothetical protein
VKVHYKCCPVLENLSLGLVYSIKIAVSRTIPIYTFHYQIKRNIWKMIDKTILHTKCLVNYLKKLY